MSTQDDFKRIDEDLVHMARIALSGRPNDTHIYVRKLARSYKSSDPQLAKKLEELLQKSPLRRAPTRRIEPEGLPLDTDSRFPLIRLNAHPDLDIEPVYGETVWTKLRQLLREQQQREKLKLAGLEPTHTVLFTGPPGVGKTHAAKWVARELGRPLATLDLSTVMSSFLGRTGNNVRAVLDFAKEHNCVLLLDELDAVAKRRDDSTEIGELKRLVTVLLQEIDEWPHSGLLISATNHPDLLDPAIWRRFEMTIDFPMPDQATLSRLCAALLDTDSNSSWASILALSCKGSSFSDVVQQTRRARRLAAMNESDMPKVLETVVQDNVQNLDRHSRQELAVGLVQTLGLSQREVSSLTGVSRDTLRKLTAKNGR